MGTADTQGPLGATSHEAVPWDHSLHGTHFLQNPQTRILSQESEGRVTVQSTSGAVGEGHFTLFLYNVNGYMTSFTTKNHHSDHGLGWCSGLDPVPQTFCLSEPSLPPMCPGKVHHRPGTP